MITMLSKFVMNGDLWHVRFTDPKNPILIDRTNVLTVAVTDPKTMTIYISDILRGSFLQRVLIHELSHAVMYSYNLVSEIHRMCRKKYWVPMEEFCANLLSDYGSEVYGIAYSVLGSEAIHIVPYHLERMIA